jgi:predicted transcriptional regulator
MEVKIVTYFTEKEEEVANLLMNLGLKKRVAKVMIYLSSKPESTTHDIERGTDLRQPEVSLATVYLIDKKWMVCKEVRGKKKGRPTKTFRLAKPLPEIFNSIEEQKKNETCAKLQMMKKLRACANECSGMLPQVYKDKPVPGEDPRGRTVSGPRLCDGDHSP